MSNIERVADVSFGKLLKAKEKQIKAALPKHLSVERMMRIAFTEINKVPKLKECTVESVIGSIIQCSQLGLEPGNALGHAYLVPFESSKKNIIECQFITGYQGMIELALRSSKVKKICSQAVYENDFFDYEFGNNEFLTHKPALTNRGNLKCFYVYAKLADGEYQFEVLPLDKINEAKKASKMSKYGPWVDNYEEMGRKTGVRRIYKYLPKSAEMALAIELDEKADRGEQDNSLILDMDMETGEIKIENTINHTKADNIAKEIESSFKQKEVMQKEVCQEAKEFFGE